jgi:predicted homoserine dehydrogenase-like protein
LPFSVARAVLFNDATITPRGAPVCDAITVAKRDLRAGEVLDGMGGFACYGLVESYEIARAQRLLPVTLSHGCRMKRDVLKDQAVSYDDVALPEGRLVDRLRAEQTEHFAPRTARSVGTR